MKVTSAVWKLSIFIVFSLGCEESLPPRIEPEQALSVRVQASSYQRVIGGFGGGNVFGGVNAHVNIRIHNLHDEVLEDSARIGGTLRVWLEDHPDTGFTIRLTPQMILGPVQIHSGLITLEPHGSPGGRDSLSLRILLPHRTDDGKLLFRLVGVSWHQEVNGDWYMLSDSIKFVADASIQVFENVQAIKAKQARFSLVYKVTPAP
jgi:hypothetical protein